MMDRRFGRENSRESKGSTTALQKKIVESHRQNETKNNAPDLTDFMNDMFFGTLKNDVKSYNLTGGHLESKEEESFDDSTRSNSSRLTQEWLEEARRMVASSPSRCESPSRLIGSPRFAAVGDRPSASILDRRDPLSRSARRGRSVEGFSEEILTKSAKHSRNRSESLVSTPSYLTEPSPASQVQKWFTNILKLPSNSTTQPNGPISPILDSTAPNLPPRQPTHRKSRFQTDPPAKPPQDIPVTSRRTFKPAPISRQDNQLLSPPKNQVESAHRRSVSSNTCSKPEVRGLSPPKNLLESAHRRSISKSTCSIEKVAPKPDIIGWQKEKEGEDLSLNGFLKEQKMKIEKILNRELDSKAKIILSGPSNNTSSMVGAICYAWLLENRLTRNERGVGDEGYIVVPVMNIRRERMWKQRQAAWLFHHVGVDATTLLFADEVDLESLMMEGKLNVLVVGQDILKSKGEVGSQCTTLTDNYCEDAYHLLQTPMLKKLLLACILLDTQNLNTSVTCSMTRDAEAVQLLLVGSVPNYRNNLFDQLMQDQRDSSFTEALRQNYGKSPIESARDNGTEMGHRKSSSVSHPEAITQNSNEHSKDVRNGKHNTTTKSAPAEATNNASRGKSKFFLAKWFGFGK